MEWILMIQEVIKMIQECLEKRREPDIVAGMNDPGRLEYFACKQIARKKMPWEGKRRGKKWRAKVREVAKEGMAELQALEPAEVELLVSGDLAAFMAKDD